MRGGPAERRTIGCPLCEGRRFAPRRFSLLECESCGLVMDPRIFERGAAERVNLEAFGEDWEPHASLWVRRFEAWKNRRYIRTIGRPVRRGRLLEIGVGSGSFLEAARTAGYDVMGCDLSAAVCRRVAERTRLPVHHGSLEELDGEAFNVVAMHHVLEHVEEPVPLLSEVRRILAPGGVVHIAVPNLACWEARLRAWHCYAPYHVTYFDARTLRAAVARAGFAPAQVGTHESFSTWFLTVARAVLDARADGPGLRGARNAGARRWWPALESLYRVGMVAAGIATWPLRVVQGAVGRGDELFLVGRRP